MGLQKLILLRNWYHLRFPITNWTGKSMGTTTVDYMANKSLHKNGPRGIYASCKRTYYSTIAWYSQIKTLIVASPFLSSVDGNMFDRILGKSCQNCSHALWNNFHTCRTYVQCKTNIYYQQFVTLSWIRVNKIFSSSLRVNIRINN